MSRAGYSDDWDGWRSIIWRGAVASAMRGERGQAFLQELADALDAMPVKELVAHEFQADGAYCALGVVGAKRGLDLTKLHPEIGRTFIGKHFGIAPALASEVMHVNDDEGFYDHHNYAGCKTKADLEFADRRDRERRWTRVRNWAQRAIDKKGAPE